MSTLKGNMFLNLINTLTGVLYPVITFPYAARVLLPDGIGAINFLNSIISYIVLLTSLGIPMYAVREIARCREDKSERDKTTVEILVLSFVLCIIGYIGVWSLAEFVPQIHSQMALFYVLSLTIIFTSIGVQWFYQAIEDFKFITIRAIIVRTLAAIALFLFVKSSSDLLIYGLIIVGSTVGNNIINFVHLRKHINTSLFSYNDLKILRHIKPTVRIFVLNLIISIYINLNTVMLGFMCDDTAVGYYTAGNKISHIALTVITSLGVVMLPRCSNLVKTEQWNQFQTVSTKALRLVIASALPCVLALILLSKPLIYLFCGINFMDAVPVLIWTAPVVLIIGISNVLGIQILYPLGRENIVIWSTVGGAVVNLSLNLLLIPKYSYVGAAIATLFAEAMVTIIQILAGRKVIPISLRIDGLPLYLTASIVMSIALIAISQLIHEIVLQLLVCIFTGSFIYGGILLLKKDSMIEEFLRFCKIVKK